MKRRRTLSKRWMPWFFMFVILIFIYKALDNSAQIVSAVNRFLSITSPFLIGVLICYILYKPCIIAEKLLSRIKIKVISKNARLLSVLSVYVVVLLMVAMFFVFIIPILVNNLIDLATNIPSYYNNALIIIHNLQEDLEFIDLDINAGLTDFAANTLKQFFDPTMIEQLARGILGLANGVFRVLISLFVSLYALIDRERIIAFVIKASDSILGDKKKSQFKKYVRQINQVIFTFIASKSLDSLINLIAITAILSILRVEYAVLLGLMAAIANFIPYLGSLVSVIVICLMTLLTGGTELAIPTAILLIVFQQMDGNYIEPRIMGNSLKISPILVIFSVIVGGAYFGVIGMFLAVPFATIVKEILVEYLDSKKARETPEDKLTSLPPD